MVAAIRTKAAAKFLFESGALFPALSDLDSIQCRHVRSIPSPQYGLPVSKAKLWRSGQHLASLEIAGGSFDNDRSQPSGRREPAEGTL
jgi:hypothetical protein